MEEENLKKSPTSEDKINENDTETLTKINENLKISNTACLSDKKVENEIVGGTGDNLENDTAKSVETEDSKINSSNKSDKSDSCSSGNNSNEGGTANVIKTGNNSLCNLLTYASDDSSDSDSSSEAESYESPQVSDK